MHCWKCETPIRWAPVLGLHCPNIRCDACKPWSGDDEGPDDDDGDPPPLLPDPSERDIVAHV